MNVYATDMEPECSGQMGQQLYPEYGKLNR